MKRFTLATTIMIVITVVAVPFDILVAEKGQAKWRRRGSGRPADLGWVGRPQK